MGGDELVGFLRAIMGGEPASGLLEIRPLGVAGGPAAGREWVSVTPGGLRRAAGLIVALAARSNVFVGVAPRCARGGDVGVIERVWSLWVDIDDERTVRDRLWAFRPLPAVVVRSGSGGAHAYWPLAEPLTPAQAQRANRRLALALAADPKATDAARILRPPGTLNHKLTPPASVVCTRLEADRFAAGAVVGHLSDTEHYRRWRRPAVPAPRPGEGAERALDGLCRVVLDAAQGSRNDAFFWALCRGLEHVASGALVESRVLDALSSSALEAGLAAHEIHASVGSARRTVAR